MIYDRSSIIHHVDDIFLYDIYLIWNEIFWAFTWKNELPNTTGSWPRTELDSQRNKQHDRMFQIGVGYGHLTWCWILIHIHFRFYCWQYRLSSRTVDDNVLKLFKNYSSKTMHCRVSKWKRYVTLCSLRPYSKFMMIDQLSCNLMSAK